MCGFVPVKLVGSDEFVIERAKSNRRSKLDERRWKTKPKIKRRLKLK